MKILLIGDSITEGFKTGILLPNLNIINKGVYGDNSEGVLKRLNADVISHNPDIVYILIGTNDFAMGRNNGQLLDTLEKIAGLLKKTIHTGEIYFTSILPTRNIKNRPNRRINEMNELIKQLCVKRGTKYFNLHSAMTDETGLLNNKYTIDGLHLTDTAYQKWAEVLQQRHT